MLPPSKTLSAAAVASVVLLLSMASPGLPAPDSGNRLVARWQERLQKVDEKLQAGKWRSADTSARKLIDEMSRRLLSGKGSAEMLAVATTFQALAEAGLGLKDDAIWHWYIAQNLNPQFRRVSLAKYGNPGVLLEKNRLRPAGEPPKEMSVLRLSDKQENLTPQESTEAPYPEVPQELSRYWFSQPVTVEIVIDAYGRVQAPVVLQGALPGKIYLGLEALRGWRFKPARSAGEPVAVFLKLQDFYYVPRWRGPSVDIVATENPVKAMLLTNEGAALFKQGKLQQAVQAYRQAIEADPESAPTHYNLGLALYTQGNLNEAIEAYRNASQLDPELAAASYNLGIALYKQGKLDQVVDVYQEAIQLDPDLAAAYYNVGIALYAQDRLDEAIEAHRNAIQLNSNDVAAYNNLGIVLRRQGKLAEAIEAHRKATRLNPRSAASYYNLAIALFEQGRRQEAIDSYRKAIQLDPKDATAYTNLGIALTEEGKLEEAVEAHRRAIRIDPGYAAAHNNLGLVLRGQGELRDAIGAFRRAIELDPRTAVAFNNLGVALRDSERLTAAVDAYREATRLDPEYAAAYYNLSVVLRELRRLDQAAEAYRKAIELDSDLPPRTSDRAPAGFLLTPPDPDSDSQRSAGCKLHSRAPPAPRSPLQVALSLGPSV